MFSLKYLLKPLSNSQGKPIMVVLIKLSSIFFHLAPKYPVKLARIHRNVSVLTSLYGKSRPNDECCEECPPPPPVCEPPKEDASHKNDGKGSDGKVRLKEPLKGKVTNLKSQIEIYKKVISRFKLSLVLLWMLALIRMCQTS